MPATAPCQPHRMPTHIGRIRHLADSIARESDEALGTARQIEQHIKRAQRHPRHPLSNDHLDQIIALWKASGVKRTYAVFFLFGTRGLRTVEDLWTFPDAKKIADAINARLKK